MTPESVPRPCACTTVLRVARVMGRAYDSAIAKSGLNITQFAVLRAVLRHPREPLSRVADDLEMDRTSLYRALKVLQEKGWVRLHSGNDRRSLSVAVTADGRRIMTRADPDWEAIQTAVVGRFGPEKWQTLVAELRRLVECAAPKEIDPSMSEAGA